jgi:hypothetical protein
MGMTREERAQAKRREAQLRIVRAARDTYDAAWKRYIVSHVRPERSARLVVRELQDAAKQMQLLADTHGVTLESPGRRAKTLLKALPPATREKLADAIVPGLRGHARSLWIETGMDSYEQSAYAAASKPRPTRAPRAQPVVVNEEGERLFTAAQIAHKLEQDPRKFRAFLRANDLRSDTGRYSLAEAKAIAKAIRKAQA